MGKYVDELQKIVGAGHWSEVNSAYRENALMALETRLANMSMLGQESWSGEAGDAARAAYRAVMEEFARFRADLEKVDRICHAGNTALQNATHSLAEITADSGFNPVEWVNETFFNADEDRAQAALNELHSTLKTYSNLLPRFDGFHDGQWDDEIPLIYPVTPTPVPVATPHHSGRSGGGGSLPSGGGYAPPGGGSGGYSPPGSGGYGGSGSDGSGSGDNHLSVDDGSTGYLAGGSGGSGGSSGLGAFALGGGSAAAAAALRARTAGLGGGGGLGSGVTGSGGILGGGTASGSGGVGASDASGSGAGAAGGRGGMMGGGGMGGGKTDKAKRAGMGGAIAPKLEDDPEYTPLPEGARAGRRGAARPVTDSGS
jgi:hypothetical protein